MTSQSLSHFCIELQAASRHHMESYKQSSHFFLACMIMDESTVLSKLRKKDITVYSGDLSYVCLVNIITENLKIYMGNSNTQKKKIYGESNVLPVLVRQKILILMSGDAKQRVG